MVGELIDLGAKRTRPHKGSVVTDLTTRQLYAANRHLRCATRVLVRVAGFTARTFADLERRLGEVDWSPWLSNEAQPTYRVTSRGSQLRHTGAIEERFAAALGTGHADGPGQLVVVRVSRDRFTISVDSSGAPLHERGWRQATAKAPLRESVAAALLLAAGWDPATPLVDPMCGSGTIPIEAALLAAGRAPGGGRDFAFRRWPCFEPGTWASVTATADSPVAPTPVILGADRDAGAVESARSNAERAGVADLVEFRQAPVSDLEAPGGGPPAVGRTALARWRPAEPLRHARDGGRWAPRRLGPGPARGRPGPRPAGSPRPHRVTPPRPRRSAGHLSDGTALGRQLTTSVAVMSGWRAQK